MVEAPVGHHCPACVQEGNRGVRPVRWSPQGFGHRGRITPVVKTLLAINVVAFLISGFRSSVVDRYSQVPVLIAHGQYERLLTAAFLHAGILHIAFNMLALVIIGPPLETAIGRLRFTGLYLLAALGGSVCSYLFSNPRIMGVGASGAIFGLFGAYFVIARSRKADTSGIVVLIVINLVFSFADPLIDWRAHIGGLVVGTFMAAGFAFAETRPPSQRRSIELAVVAAVAVLLIGLVALRTGQLRAVA
jgi:membrane associated rhomboid family serine protease